MSISLTSGLIDEIDQAAVEHGRRERKADAVWLVVERDRAERARRPAREIRRRRGSSRYRPTAPPDWARPGCARAPLLFERVDGDLERFRSPINWPTRKPNGAAPDSTPAATTGDIGSRCRHVGAADAAAAGAAERAAGLRDRQLRGGHCPIADIGTAPIAEHVPLHAEFAAGLPRSASMKRTSSMICCGRSTCTVLIGSGPNWRAISTALSSVTASGEVPLTA